jgi:hypothetical protein
LLAPSSPAEAQAIAKTKAAAMEEKPIIPAAVISSAIASLKPSASALDKASVIADLASKIKESTVATTQASAAATPKPNIPAFDVAAIVLDEDTGMAVALPSRRK